MTKDELRRMFLDNMPKQIITGHQIGYAEWLERLILENYVINKNDSIERVNKSDLLDEWNKGYFRGCEDTAAAYENNR